MSNRLARVALGFCLLNLLACTALPQKAGNNRPVSPTPTPVVEENKKMSEEFINAIRQNDRNILQRAQQAPKSLPKDLDQINATLEGESRELAVEFVTRQDNELAGTYLLRRTADADVNVATLAADNLAKIINKPATADLLGAIPKRTDPFIRGKLYLEAGRREDNFVLEELRRQAGAETDREAKLQSLAARVKRGGGPEKAEFLDLVRRTEPDDALPMQDLLLYIDNPNLAKGLIPWLDNEAGVMRLGSDRQNMMARMSDVAVWTAHLLRIKLPFETTSLRNFTAEEIAATRKILETLPE